MEPDLMPPSGRAPEDLTQMLIRRANAEKSILIGNLLEKAKNGDPKALDQVMNFVLDQTADPLEEKLEITDERFNDIILTRAARVLSLLPGQPPSATA